MKRVWEGMRVMSGYSNASSKSSQLPDCNTKYANELNTFYSSLDMHDFSMERKNLCDIMCDLNSNDYDLSVTEDEVSRLFSSVNPSKAAGPDRLSPKILKNSFFELSYIFTYIFTYRTDILKLFYQSTIKEVWRYCLICWGGNLKKTDIERLNDIIKRAERVVGVGLAPVDSVYRELLGQKVCKDAEYPLHDTLFDWGSVRGRLRLPPLNTNRYRDAFIPRAIKLYNSLYK